MIGKSNHIKDFEWIASSNKVQADLCAILTLRLEENILVAWKRAAADHLSGFVRCNTYSQ